MESDCLPYGRHYLDESDIAAVVDVLRHGWLTQGEKVLEFEDRLAARAGARHAVVCSSGTAALHLSMLAAGAQPGDEVVCPAVTFAATSNCALYVGARPRFVDIDYKTVCMDPALLRAALSKKTKAVLPVHFAGLPADMSAISESVRTACPQALIVEDACHALGASHPDGSPVGCLKYSDMTVFSFHPVKHIATGEGGAVLTNRDDLAERLRLFRSHGITRDPERLTRSGEGPWYYEMQELGFNYRIPDLNCALGISQLTKLDCFVARRRQIATQYQEAFSGLEILEIPECGASKNAAAADHRNAWHIYVVRIDFDRLGKSRRKVVTELAEAGVGTQVHYYPVPLQPYYRRRFGYSDGDFPVSEKHYARALTLPLFPSMTDSEVNRVTRAVRKTLCG